MLSENINVSLIGAGSIARACHLPTIETYQRQGRLRLDSVVDQNSQKRLTDAGFYPSHRELIDNNPPGLAVVATPNASHFSVASDLLNAGWNVALEKPPTLTLKEGQILVDLASQNSVVLFFMYHARYSDAIQELSERLEHRERLKIEAATRENPNDYGHTVAEQLKMSGIWMDVGINMVSQVCFLLEKLGQSKPLTDVTVSEAKFVLPSHGDNEFEAQVAFETPKADVRIDLGWVSPLKQEIRSISLRDKSYQAVLDVNENSLTINKKLEFKGPAGLLNEYVNMYRHLLSCLGMGLSFSPLTEITLAEQVLSQAVRLRQE